ncbi:MAG: hypothetical protein ABJA78_01510 [Ferruginibacter sp.]
MKKYILAVVVLLSGLYCQAQYQLDENIPDTRNKRESFAKLPKDDVRTDVATFAMSAIDESMGRADLKKITFSSHTPNSMTFEGENVKAVVTTGLFDFNKHKLDYDEKYIIKIDKKTYYGSYPNMPKTTISNITMLIGKDTVAIPQSAYSDLYNLNLTYKDKAGKERSTNMIYFSKFDNRVYLYLFSKDETGSYEVTFVIHAGKYERRILDYGFL